MDERIEVGGFMEPTCRKLFRPILSTLPLAVFVRMPPNTGARFVLTQAAQPDSNQADSQFGATAAGVGDLNGDGFEDFVVGAPYCDSEEVDEGAAFVYLGTCRAQTVPAAGPLVWALLSALLATAGLRRVRTRTSRP